MFFENLLQMSKYDEQETKFGTDGFKNGFELGYEGHKERQFKSRNLPFNHGDKINLWNKVMKEVKLNHFAGPFEKYLLKITYNLQLVWYQKVN